MDAVGKIVGGGNHILKNSENTNPNVVSPSSKFSGSPTVTKSGKKGQKTVSNNPNPNPLNSPSPKNKIRQRRFVVAKKNTKKEKENLAVAANCKCNKAGDLAKKCLCVAYETLRASQEEFFKNRTAIVDDDREIDKLNEFDRGVPEAKEREDVLPLSSNLDKNNSNEDEVFEQMRLSAVKRSRDKLLEAARESVPESGSGRVQHLVKAFEKLLMLPKSDNVEQEHEKEIEDTKRGIKWALPGLQAQKVSETEISCASLSPSDFFLTSDSLGLNSRRSSSLDSSQGSISSRTSGGGRRSRRNSTESSGTYARRHWRKKHQLRATSLKPFKLRTEERGKQHEEEFSKKVKQLMEEEEKLRIPIAQGLPWTTDEPECLVKPPVKEPTRPVDLLLHSDVRAVERAEFDNQVAEKLSFIEQYKAERERQQKLAEEEEIRRLRKELVPKAQPMPYFDRPFIPRRSVKHPTIPREPKFHLPQNKKIKSCMSWNEEMFMQHHH